VSGRLINAQEDERRHRADGDDLNQRLALLSVDASWRRAFQEAKATDRSSEWPHIRELSAEVHDLSYQLHPAKLDQLAGAGRTKLVPRSVATDGHPNRVLGRTGTGEFASRRRAKHLPHPPGVAAQRGPAIKQARVTLDAGQVV
jgi:hypothetical protein